MRAVAWSAAALFAGLALLAALATVRVRLDRGRRERAVVELLGGSPSFLIVPTALAAALVACAVVGIGLHVYAGSITDALSATLGRVEVVAPTLSIIAAFVGGSALVGLVGGGLAGASRVAR